MKPSRVCALFLVFQCLSISQNSGAQVGTHSGSGVGQQSVRADEVSFACSLEHQNEMDQPGTIWVNYTNRGPSDLAVSFHLHLVANNGAVEDDKKGGGSTKVRPKLGGGTYKWPPFTSQQTVNHPTVVPVSCTITDIEICPANPPRDHVGYYSPFRSPKCIKASPAGPFNFAPPPACTFAVYGNVGGEVYRRNGQSFGVAWSHGKATLEEAQVDAYAKLEATGAERAKNNFALSKFDFEAHFTLASDCTHSHGAVAAVRKVFSTNQRLADEGVWGGVGAGTGDTKESAEQLALAGCEKMGKYSVDQGQQCQVLTSW